MVGNEGVEPPFAGCRPAVLPLNESPMYVVKDDLQLSVGRLSLKRGLRAYLLVVLRGLRTLYR
jgi:hypothetical protein